MALSREVLRSLATHSDLVETLRPLRTQLTFADVVTLKQMVDEEKTRNAQEAISLARVAEAIAGLLGDDGAGLALARWAMGNALYHHCRYREAITRYRRAARWYQARGQWLEVARLQINQMAVLQEKGEHEGALALESAARQACEAAGEEGQIFLAILEMNLSSAYQQMGRLQEALLTCERCKALLLALNNTIEAARIEINRANILRDMARFAEAEALLLAARATLQAAGQIQEVARAEMNLGMVAYVQGRYQIALTWLEQARDGFQTITNPVEIAVVDLYRSYTYLHLNLLDEAIGLAGQAEQVFEQNDGMLCQWTEALINQAVGYQRKQHYGAAVERLIQARRLLRRQHAPERILLLDLERVWLAIEMGDLAKARRLLRWITPRLSDVVWPAQVAQAYLLRARCIQRQRYPRDEDLKRLGMAVLALDAQHHLPKMAMQAHQLLGEIRERDGALGEALHHYQAAIQTVEGVRGGLVLDEFQTGFMDDKLRLYENAIRVSERLGNVAHLLYYLALAGASHLPATLLPSPALMDEKDRAVWETLQGLRANWHTQPEHQNPLLRPTALRGAPQLAESPPAVQRNLEEQIAELARRLQVRFAPLALPRVPHSPRNEPVIEKEATDLLTRLQNRLMEGEALLHFYSVGGALRALVVTQHVAKVVKLADSTSVRQRLDHAWMFGLKQIAFLRHPNLRAGLDAFARDHLRHFYNALFAPLESYLLGIRSLFVLLPPEWHALPLAAFFDGEQYLIERFQLTHLSGLDACWTELAGKSQATHCLVVGYSDTGDLLHAALEAAAVQTKLMDHVSTTLLSEERATVAHFQALSQRSDLIHLATHALFRPDNPFFSWILLDDARLTVSDLYEHSLPRRPLVVLSCCETGRGRPRGGGLLGMSRGFLAAGATGLVVSLWKVEDGATANLMGAFYEHLDLTRPLTSTAAHALQQAQQQGIRDGMHPFLWAAFLFIQG